MIEVKGQFTADLPTKFIPLTTMPKAFLLYTKVVDHAVIEHRNANLGKV